MCLPDLLPDGNRFDVSVVQEDKYNVPLAASKNEWYYDQTPKEGILYNSDVALVIVRNGKTIVVNPAPRAKERTIQLFVVGVVMPVLLHQRERLVLHAGGVEMVGEGIAFLGERGRGKSTAIAALHSRGHALVTDDVLPVGFENGSLTVFPGYPQLKLNLDVAAALGIERNSLFPLEPGSPKFGFRVTEGFSKAAVPLKRVYLLSKGSNLEILPISPQESFLELIRNSILVGGKAHFTKCAKLAGEVPFFRIVHPYSLSSLHDLAAIVEEHVLEKRHRPTPKRSHLSF